ncbi:rhomboid-domain-containing protein [Mucor ambiguus]|uniref:Rhomboid-type serine protease n=1 Tax=Mucor ambiguus TaxID=91626 RepID=A0A0C9MYV2_9FUNG|nr:rhomboid-domain-containing protein [Mucor ambiguus]
MNNANNSDFNPFRENEAPPAGSPHVNFAAKSPSIMPTPIYDDTSSIGSSPYQSPALSTPSTAMPLSPSPLGRQVYEADQSEHDKTEVYGPTFTAEDQYSTASNVPPATGALLSRGFVPPSEQTEEIQLYETSNQNNNNRNFSPSNSNANVAPPLPEQSRVDIFMSKLKGYQQPKEYNNLESGINTSRGFAQPIPVKQRGAVYKHLFGGGSRFAIFTWISGVIMIGVFVYELIRNNALAGSVIQTNPFNPMIGPNYMALINMGSKFVPCMRDITQYPASFTLNNCYQSLESTCTIEQVCGFGGFNGQSPSQGFRFFTPIFLHAGVVHILLNLLTHFSSGSEIERSLGIIRYAILYLVSGVWGFILSGVLAGPLVSSMGCSGALFGIIGYTVIELVVQWKETLNPGRELVKLLFVIVISLVLGLLPGLDNFAHIGGLIMGLLLGILLAPNRPTATRRTILFVWIARIAALVVVIVLYVVFLRIFYTSSDLSTICPNCKYLSCLPVNGWCDTV